MAGARGELCLARRGSVPLGVGDQVVLGLGGVLGPLLRPFLLDGLAGLLRRGLVRGLVGHGEPPRPPEADGPGSRGTTSTIALGRSRGSREHHVRGLRRTICGDPLRRVDHAVPQRMCQLVSVWAKFAETQRPPPRRRYARRAPSIVPMGTTVVCLSVWWRL